MVLKKILVRVTGATMYLQTTGGLIGPQPLFYLDSVIEAYIHI